MFKHALILTVNRKQSMKILQPIGYIILLFYYILQTLEIVLIHFLAVLSNILKLTKRLCCQF